MIRLPRIIGHRGAAATAPENTLEGFRAAAAEGAGWVEFDVRLSSDGVPVVIHDATLERTAGVEVQIDRTPMSEIRRLSRRHPTPTLAETLACLGELGLGANVEIKAVRARRAIVDAVAETIAALDGARSVPVLISSFSLAILENVARLAGHLPRGVLGSRRTDGMLILTLPSADYRQRGQDVLAALEENLPKGQLDAVSEGEGETVVSYSFPALDRHRLAGLDARWRQLSDAVRVDIYFTRGAAG